MLTTLLAGAAVAISFAAPPGPVLVETIRRGLRGGFRPALLVQLGSIIGDMVWCAAALFGLAQFVSQPWVRLLLGGAGVLVLFWLGLRGIREALAAQPLTRNPSSPPAVPPESLNRPAEEHTQAFRSGMAISLTNPWAIGYWVGIGGAMIAAGIVGASLAQTAAFVGGYAAGVSVYALVVAGCFRWLHRHLRPGGRAARIITGLCGLSLFGLGLLLGWQMLGSLAA